MGNAQYTLQAPRLNDVQGISPINTINPTNELFLKSIIYDDRNHMHTLYVLPDGGNRAKCIIREDVFFKIFPNCQLEPVKDAISTAVRGGAIQIVGTPKHQIEFLLADGRYSYKTRPLVVKNFILPCLFSASDLKRMQMNINYGTNIVTMGKVKTQLVHLPKKEETDVCTIRKCTIYAGTEKVIPIRAQDELGGAEMLFLPEGSLEALAVASVNPVRSSGLAFTKVVNWTDHPITIKAGQKIGTGFVAAVQAEQQKTVKPGYSQKTKEQFLQSLKEDLKLESNQYISKEQKRNFWNYSLSTSL